MQAHFNKYARLLETPQIAQGNHYVQWLFGANVSLSKIPTASKVMEEIAFRDRAELQSVAASEPKTVRWPTLMFATKYLREQPLAQPRLQPRLQPLAQPLAQPMAQPLAQAPPLWQLMAQRMRWAQGTV